MSEVRRREFITLLGGAAAWPVAVRAQQPGRVWRIGVLETTSMALNAVNFEAFRQSLRHLGYIEEQNLIIEYRSAEGRGERFADLAADLLRLNIDVIVTRGTPAVLAAKEATTTTPIVMAAMGAPLMVVASLANPGGNITCPSRKSYPRVAMMQSGQDWCGDDGPRSLDGPS
jgi:putative tryptophan/tyrosine transport system substrate-binding protein